MSFARSAILRTATRSAAASSAGAAAAPAAASPAAAGTPAAAAAAEAAGLSPLGVAFFGSLCVSTFGLGCWQSRRYFEKVDQMAIREAGLAASPIPLESGANAKEESKSREHFRRVTVKGAFRHEDEILMGPRGPPPGALAASGPSSGRSSGGMSSSPQGYFVLTPLVRSDGAGTVLVNRGWVPMHFAKQGLKWDRPKGDVEIVGVPSETETPRFLSPPHPEPKRLLWMDRSALEAGTNTVGDSPTLVIETSPDDEGGNGTTGGAAIFPAKPDSSAVGEFKVTPPVHAGYAVTWFGLSGAGMIMTRKLMTRGRG